MRILHTSDWHLGRSFHREDLLGAQATFADHLVETVRNEAVDCVLVSGDVYDRAIPPVDAVRLYGETLRRLSDLTRVVLIAGNHDSATRLGVGSGLMDKAGVYVRTEATAVGRPVVLDGVAFHCIPYLEPELVRTPWGLAERTHTAVLTEAMRRVNAHAHPGPRVVLSHSFVLGGETSDSERDISVGGVSFVPANVFDGIDYVALGHLHGRKQITDTVRYSGSPLAYSFSEEHQVKGSWLVDLGVDGVKESAFVQAPVPRRLARLRGTLPDLLADSAHERFTEHWLQVTLTDAQRPAGAMDRLRARFPHVLMLGFEPSESAETGDDWVPRAERSGLDLACDFVAEMGDAPADEAERALLSDAFTCCRQEEKIKVPEPRVAV
ncbi:MAG: exonuclease SbcCD subunit D [Streptosporangiaceae bacterium]